MYGKTINMGKLTLQKHVHPAVTATKKVENCITNSNYDYFFA